MKDFFRPNVFSSEQKHILSERRGGKNISWEEDALSGASECVFFSFCWHFIPIGEFLLKLICNLHLDLIIFLSKSHSVAGQLRLTSLFAACLTFQLLNLAIHLNSVESMEQMRFFFHFQQKSSTSGFFNSLLLVWVWAGCLFVLRLNSDI